MFENLSKKDEGVASYINSITHNEEGEEDNTIINLTYVKVPLTPKLRERQYEEQLREKYNIPKEKKGELL
ncbi:hypothetical protein [Desulfosporosinus sp.]|uniref:hypothetical protein n=1 Tax=Desulfosporosinus sp. TaxID=157907 RepID=UPI00231CABC7|nr:hypothetical protein [Desulfosporosinus sp.]MDA8222501.1 hypothetical protein [Desulfitobacterium hafniense]